MLFEVSLRDPATFAIGQATLMVVALLGYYVPDLQLRTKSQLQSPTTTSLAGGTRELVADILGEGGLKQF